MSSLAARSSRTLSDRQWQDINLHVGISDAARADVEGAIEAYRRRSNVEQSKPTAKQVRERLNAVFTAANQLVVAMKSLGDAERLELRAADFFWPEDMSPDELDAHIKGIFEAIDRQAEVVAELITSTIVDAKSYSRKTRRAVNALVMELGRILRRFNGPPISRKKPVMKFLLAVFQSADPKMSSHSVEQAVRNISRGVSGTENRNDLPRGG